MWIFSKNNFLSIVEDINNKDNLMVRARFDDDIESLFPNAEVKKYGGTDYMYRVSISKEEVSKVIETQVKNIDYNNFKNSNTDMWRDDYLFNCWDSMKNAQDINEGCLKW